MEVKRYFVAPTQLVTTCDVHGEVIRYLAMAHAVAKLMEDATHSEWSQEWDTYEKGAEAVQELIEGAMPALQELNQRAFAAERRLKAVEEKTPVVV